MGRPRPVSTLFPYTTLFRSHIRGRVGLVLRFARPAARDAQHVHHIIVRRLELRLREVRKQARSEEHTSELQSHHELVCRLLLEKKKSARIVPSLATILPSML